MADEVKLSALTTFTGPLSATDYAYIISGGTQYKYSPLTLTTRAPTTKTTIDDADEVGGSNSASSFSWVKWSWTTIKAFLKTYFDLIYAPEPTPQASFAVSEWIVVSVGPGTIYPSGGPRAGTWAYYIHAYNDTTGIENARWASVGDGVVSIGTVIAGSSGTGFAFRIN